MDGGMMMEPELTQAVKIVLKFEIQSLLSRLSEAGEEYIVLTASTDDGTCGHLGSSKGEGFVQKSSLQSIKQDFLKFCTGKDKRDPDTSVPVVSAPPKPNRRKSTPRCKFSQSKHVVQAADISEEAEFTSTNDSYTVDTTCALDLSDRPVGYSYTLDNDGDLSSYSNGSHSKFMYEERVGKSENLNKILPKFAWQNEQPVSSVLEKISVNGNESYMSGIKEENHFSETSVFDSKDQISTLEQLSFGRYGLNENVGKQKVQTTGRNRRKSKKVPVKVEKQEPSHDLKLSLMDESNASFANAEPMNAEQTNTSIMLEKPLNSIAMGDDLTNSLNNKNSGNVRKSTKKQNMAHITDMKSAFEEIGNMAKCLICNKILANKNNRTFHWRSHVGDKRYSCDICNKAFTHPSNMRSHRKIHTDEKPFPCDLCERRFRRRDYLLQHLERFHYNPKPQTEKSLNEMEVVVKTEEIQ